MSILNTKCSRPPFPGLNMMLGVGGGLFLTFFYFLQVSTEEEFSDLPRELLLNLLPSEDLHVDSEYQVFQAALSWLEHDVGSRRRFVFDILKHVRLPLVPSKQLDEYQAQCRDLSLQVALNRLVRKPS